MNRTPMLPPILAGLATASVAMLLAAPMGGALAGATASSPMHGGSGRHRGWPDGSPDAAVLAAAHDTLRCSFRGDQVFLDDA